MNISHQNETKFGKLAKNKLSFCSTPTFAGALAALETFYYAFNNKDLDVFIKIWVNHTLIQLNNPVGGIIWGIEPIRELYRNIFAGKANVWVEFGDIVSYAADRMVVFAGRETGEFETAGKIIALQIRTTRIFVYHEKKWSQIHHHGSIDNADALKRYQEALDRK